MTFPRARAFCVAAASLIFVVGFLFGFISSLHVKPVARSAPRPAGIQPYGDASQSVRAGVLHSLQLFQAGYTARDPGKINMHDLFDPDTEILIVGTDEPNWVNGYSAVVQFVQADWTKWGDLRLNLNNPVISSWQDVAWVMTEGEVQFGATTRTLLFSAVLVRHGDSWLFRKMEFQWDELKPNAHDLLKPGLYMNTFSVVLRKLIGSTSQ